MVMASSTKTDPRVIEYNRQVNHSALYKSLRLSSAGVVPVLPCSPSLRPSGVEEVVSLLSEIYHQQGGLHLMRGLTTEGWVVPHATPPFDFRDMHVMNSSSSSYLRKYRTAHQCPVIKDVLFFISSDRFWHKRWFLSAGDFRPTFAFHAIATHRN